MAPSRDSQDGPRKAAGTADTLRAAAQSHLAGDTARAEAGYRAVLAEDSESVTALYSLAGLLLGRQAAGEAAELLARASRLAPDDASILASLAAARRRLGAWADAHAAATAALALKPDHPGALYSRALAARHQGDYATAAADLDALLATGRDEASIHLERGIAALGLNDPAGALAPLQRARSARPEDVDLAVNVAIAANRLGQPETALEALESVTALAGAHPEWHAQLGHARDQTGDEAGAKEAFAHAAAAESRDRQAYLRLAILEMKAGESSAAEAHLRQGLARVADAVPPSPAATDAAYMANNLGHILREQARPAEAVAALRQAVAFDPSFEKADANLLLTLHYDPAQTRESIYAAHRAWHQRHAAQLEAAAQPPAAGPRDKAPLTVGVLGAKLRAGPALVLYLPGLANLDRRHVRLVVYDLGSKPDKLNARLRAAADAYFDVAEESAEAIAQRIRGDGIDILINKMGHAEGRMGVCARKPAPVQVQWGGFNTSALDGMDFFIADAQECPPELEPYFTERIYRLPDDYVVYTRPGEGTAPAVGPLPARANGHVTFGCFNNPAKLNPVIAARWGALMARVPGSRLHLRGKPFDDPQGRAHVLGMLEAAGIDRARVTVAGFSPWASLMAAYNAIDIHLDPWPYSGGLTTIEAMWMGVPTVTLPGPTFVGRHAATHLTTAGLGDWVVSDAQDYIGTAAAWAEDLDALAALRGRLREQLAASPLCDGPRFARHLESALYHMWRSKVDEQTTGRND